MEPGHLCLVHYGEVPSTWHARILLSHVHGNDWYILTPDFDRYIEQLDGLNPNYTDFVYLGSNPAVPPRVPPHEVYGFSPMDPAFLANQISLAKLEANAERLARGLPIDAGPGVPAAPVAAVVGAVPAPPPAPLPGVLGGGAPVAPVPAAPAAAPAGGAPAAPQSYVWVCVENAGGHTRGEVVCREPAPMPPGHVMLGEKALIPACDGSGIPCCAKRVPENEAASYRLEDLRILPVYFDQQGTRRRDFAQAVALFVEGVPQGGGLQLEGPATCLNICKGLRDQSMTPTSFHEFWVRSAEIPKGDRSTYEHECLSRILESLVTVDQLNVSCLQGAELICRRMQVIREAHRISPTSPDYSSADYFMGWKYRRGAHGVDASLSNFVAGEMKNDAMIMKESRKAREEAQSRRQASNKKGGGGADKQ
mmetsp:Transcript_69667/g.109961  ORF Transcript_69667/g.109961 Transcript_69667/m.109961 type:complete len:422 (-) Transcript_69667:584-1849(-)